MGVFLVFLFVCVNQKDQREKNHEGDQKKPDDKKDHGTAVFKMDFHCDGCTKKVVRFVSSLDGVEDVKADFAANKLTVTGKVDPALIKERLEKKTKKIVELVSPRPKKDGGGGKKLQGKTKKKGELISPRLKKEGGGDHKTKEDDEKPKEISTTVLKIELHCNDCIHKIRKTILRFKGVAKVDVYAAKDLVTVKGTMDVKGLVPYLKEKLKTSIEVVLPNKEEDSDQKAKEANGGDHDKEDKEPAREGGGDGEKKEKEANVQWVQSTVVSKIRLHYDSCIPEIRKIMLKFMLKVIFNVLFRCIFSGVFPAWLFVE
ncbi:hypothetical protein F2P56_007579 [Juglans regia]|uniref:HMA domain-containing protein n=2 Tax=Juglans regia TaxID=51240 RepID=A0A834D3E1_JUGRE|nr:heavy metal-associated isoprenylated plant protein 3-like isoform X1 [Juglans regia]KAF5475810.1 hypothetical protein F2P56_007579 [Juglans regia]